MSDDDADVPLFPPRLSVPDYKPGDPDHFRKRPARHDQNGRSYSVQGSFPHKYPSVDEGSSKWSSPCAKLSHKHPARAHLRISWIFLSIRSFPRRRSQALASAGPIPPSSLLYWNGSRQKSWIPPKVKSSLNDSAPLFSLPQRTVFPFVRALPPLLWLSGDFPCSRRYQRTKLKSRCRHIDGTRSCEESTVTGK